MEELIKDNNIQNRRIIRFCATVELEKPTHRRGHNDVRSITYSKSLYRWSIIWRVSRHGGHNEVNTFHLYSLRNRMVIAIYWKRFQSTTVLKTNLTAVINEDAGRSYRSRDAFYHNHFYIGSSGWILDPHVENCFNKEQVIIQIPSKKIETRLSSKTVKVDRLLQLLFVFYYLESLMQPVSSCTRQQQSTETMELHEPCGYSLVGVEHGNPSPVFAARFIR